MPDPVKLALFLLLAFTIAGFAQTAWFRHPWSRAFAAPLDGGRTLRGRRLFGDNKTVRGAVVMVGGTIAATLALALLARLVPALAALPLARVQAEHPALWGALLGTGYILGELPNSFAKRRLGIAPGERRGSLLGAAIAVYDQADFVPMSALTLRPLWRMTATEVAEAFAVVAAVHAAVNVVGYAVGARTSPV